jgi:glycosyltransferase involved in cell wall biosynthesis
MNQAPLNNKINVLHLRDSPWIDGPGRTILETGAQIDRSDFNYIIGAFSLYDATQNDLVEAARARGIQAFEIKERHPLDLKAVSTISSFIKRNNVHIIHSHEVRSNLIGLFCAKRNDVKVVTTLHGWIENNRRDRCKVALDKFSLRFFDMVIVVSELLKATAIKHRIQPDRVHLLRNSIVVDNFVIDDSDDSFRHEFAIPPDTVLIANIGRLSPEKGQADFIQAAIRILKRNKKTKFIIIGIGPEEAALKQMVRESGLSNYFIFTGYRKDISRIYNSLDLVVQSSYTEGMPNVILESLLMKTPVIATRVGGTPEIVHNNVTGILIEPGNVSELAKHIDNFLKNKDIYVAMAVAGKQFVEKACSYKYRTAKLSKLYHHLMNETC